MNDTPSSNNLFEPCHLLQWCNLNVSKNDQICKKEKRILTGQKMVEIHNYRSVFELHITLIMHHKLMYIQRVTFSMVSIIWTEKLMRFSHMYTFSLLSNPHAKVMPTICCCTPTVHKVKSHSLTHTTSQASSKCRQVAWHFVHTSFKFSCF